MTRIRQQNVTAAQWSSNGEALGALDLTLPENEAFRPTSSRRGAAEGAQRRSRSCRRPWPRSLDPARRRRRRGDEGLGARRHPLHPHVPAADRLDRGSTTPSSSPPATAGCSPASPAGADPGRARRLLLPDRRPARNLRGPRLHRLGPDQPFILGANGTLLCIPTAFASRPAGARRQTRCCARWMRPRSAIKALRLLGDEQNQRVFTTVGPEQYFLIDEQYFERPDLISTGRTCSAPSRRRGTSSTTTTSARSRAGAGLHDGVRTGDEEARHPGQDPPTRSRRPSTRSRRCSRTPTSAPTTSSC